MIKNESICLNCHNEFNGDVQKCPMCGNSNFRLFILEDDIVIGIADVDYKK